jgi:hypothetical protein
MAGIVTLEKALWALSVLLKGVLIALLLYRKNHRVYPYLFLYALIALIQSAVLFTTYTVWGFDSPTARTVGWGVQGLVIAARALAVVEICRRVLARYRGIWALAWRMLLLTSAFVLVYAWAVSRPNWQLAVLSTDRGLELSIAVTIVILFLFVKYYEIPVGATVRYLSTGLFLFSVFSVLNNTVLETWLHSYASLWNVLGTLAFVLSLLLWIWAVREKQPETLLEPELMTTAAYHGLMPEINDRLKSLNEQLSQFWRVEANRS